MQSSFTMCVAKDGERLPFERVLVPRDFDVIWQVPDVGSVSCFPLTGSTTTS
jgi:hypothetical protein